jgi:hypothetical protein
MRLTVAVFCVLALAVAAGCSQMNPSGPGAVQPSADSLAAAAERAQPLVITASCSIAPGVAQFRAALGALNANVVGSQPGGRREINWDGVPAAFTNTTSFPEDFFNQAVVGRARGVVLSTDGSGLSVADDDFAFINPAYPSDFDDFSPLKTFSGIESNRVGVDFFVPGTSTRARATGFGVVFSDADNTGSAAIKLLGSNGQSLGVYHAPACPGGFSFVGVMFPQPVIASVQVISGHGPLGPGAADISRRDHGPARDLVIMDDFIYGEPRAGQ